MRLNNKHSTPGLFAMAGGFGELEIIATQESVVLDVRSRNYDVEGHIDRAVDAITTPTRRAALRGTVAAFAASLASAAQAAAYSPDAAIVALCNYLIEIGEEIAALYARRITIADEERTEPELTAIYAMQNAAIGGLERLLPPTTLAGAKAVARASLAVHGCKDAEGNIIPECDGHWLALVACEYLSEVCA